MTQKYKAFDTYEVDGITIISPNDILFDNNGKIYNATKRLDIHIDNLRDYASPFDQTISIITPTVDKEFDDIDDYIDDIDRLKRIHDEMMDTYIRKNNDYGNSFEQSLDEEGLAAARIRMGDKWNRFKTLSKGKQIQVNDESITDTLLDMANYAIMTIMWIKKNM